VSRQKNVIPATAGLLHEKYFLYSIGFSTLFFFFLLDQKETKNQDKPDPSGRFVWPSRSWVATVLAVLQIYYY